MRLPTILILICISSYKLFAQEKRTNLSGKLSSNELSVENIHILNKNSNQGTISNYSGEFQIYVKTNDTLIISGIQFFYKEVIITKHHFKSRVITIELFQKTNELEEVEVRAHNLQGNLTIDSDKVKKNTSKVSRSALDFSMIDFSKPVVLDIDDMDMSKPPNISHLVNPMALGIGGSVGFGKYISKEERKLKLLKKEDNAIKSYRVFFLDSFFTEILKIPTEEIDIFLVYCESKAIFTPNFHKRKIKIIDLLIKESKNYKCELLIK